jgi:hypothetical protein
MPQQSPLQESRSRGGARDYRLTTAAKAPASVFRGGRAGDECHAGVRREHPPVQDAARHRRALLQGYLKIESRKAAEDPYAFHAPPFQRPPRPSFPGLQNLCDVLAKKFPAAASLKETDIADSSFIDELERGGFIDRLYAADRK